MFPYVRLVFGSAWGCGYTAPDCHCLTEADMTTEAAQYEIVSDFVARCEAVMAKHTSRYGHIDARLIRMTMITNRLTPSEGPLFKLIRLNNPIALLCSFRYVVVTWQEVWAEMDGRAKELMIGDVLDCLSSVE